MEPEFLSNLEAFFLKLSYNESQQDSSSREIMKDMCGFNLDIRKSSIKNAGDGVFVSRGFIKQYALAAMYPGT